MTVEGKNVGSVDQFPIGMRVLAVDDDPICLKVLETLLLRCKYHVTTTNQAIKALNMLRENRDKFDLVISDVHMPDMDGFKLLELVGLEMDLPVIMLSANGETKAVMKGITHGACDYLLKPVRIEELRNIWQHVVRRKKVDQKDRHSLDIVEDNEKTLRSNSEGTQALGANGQSDRNGKVYRKRKDQYDEDEDDCEENTQENEDSSTQKKPRVVWSVELHRKFVAAVNQLGIDKAVPKRILDLMNVDKLSRENVASHLQKYRLYLKRLSAVATQQANMAAALGGRDPSYLHMGTFDSHTSFHGLSSSGQFHSLAPFQTSGVSSRENPSLLGLPGLAPGMVQIICPQNNTRNSMNDLSTFQDVAALASEHVNLFQGIPTSLELDQLQQKQKHVNEANKRLTGILLGSPSKPFIGMMNSSSLGNHSSVGVPSLATDHLEMDSGVSSCLSDLNRCNETWQSAASLSGCNTNTFPIGASFSTDNLASCNKAKVTNSTISQINGNLLNVSSNNLMGREMQFQTSSIYGNSLLMPSAIDVDPKYLNCKTLRNIKQDLEDTKQQNALEQVVGFSSSLNSSLPKQAFLNAAADSHRLQNEVYNKVDTSTINQNAAFLKHFKTDNSVIDNHVTYDENILATSNMPYGFGPNTCNFDELMNAVIKPERDDIGFIDGELGCDLFPLSSCM
ncbi:Two-component response regulator ARR12 [Apostasia shenzhenica]|uniref:Two-component response regulator n=1 Tax=Apostasia shenzhenica TaxID=1088818 RepID=A0A2H9ZY94_9ASPA|nr:Two-component response regulator ARR12 [Apostasia shenzhenica]